MKVAVTLSDDTPGVLADAIIPPLFFDKYRAANAPPKMKVKGQNENQKKMMMWSHAPISGMLKI
jgi:hypothetical protein